MPLRLLTQRQSLRIEIQFASLSWWWLIDSISLGVTYSRGQAQQEEKENVSDSSVTNTFHTLAHTHTHTPVCTWRKSWDGASWVIYGGLNVGVTGRDVTRFSQSGQICAIRGRWRSYHISAVCGPDSSLTNPLIATWDLILPDRASPINFHSRWLCFKQLASR